VPHALKHHDLELRKLLPKLQGQRKAREPAAHDHDIRLPAGGKPPLQLRRLARHWNIRRWNIRH
jgi:hypothetical protein